MKFRQYISVNDIPAGRFSLNEADLLGAPASGTSTSAGESPLSKTPWTNPSQDAQGAGDSQPPEQPLGSGRPPDATDGQLRKAGELANELLKLLTGLPRPWNTRFHVFSRALRSLIGRLGDIS
ncbi:MAG TPA: hypothetical protein VFW33_21585 [Gemmataceae bacterium]|nr:hypothetical protein [Gemmataceae bacterium]